MIASKDDLVGDEHRPKTDGAWKKQPHHEQPARESASGNSPNTAVDDHSSPAGSTIKSRVARALSLLYAHIVCRPSQPLQRDQAPCPPADDCPSRQKERRAFPRRESDCVVSVCLHGQMGLLTQQEMAWRLHSSTRKGSLVDISMNGVAFILDERIDKDEELLLRVTNRQFAKNVDAQARVVSTISDEDGRWRITCQFHKNLSFEQVHDLGRNLFQSEIV